MKHLDLLTTLEELISIPSVNPMGRAESDPTFGEARLTQYLEQTLTAAGLTTWRQPAMPGRENLIARLDGDVPPPQGGPVILLDAHQDTVPVEGMTVEPFRPKRRDGRVYGRGACDAKGPMAAMLAAVARLAAERPPEMPTILMSFTVNEEYGFDGARRLAESWTNRADTPRPTAAIIAEPTGLDVVMAQKGVIRWRCKARGRAAHSSRPELGENAIYRMARIIGQLDRFEAQLARDEGHPLCGPATLSVGTIRGGTSVNTVPDECEIEIDVRVPPGEDPAASRDVLISHLKQMNPTADWLVHDPPYMAAPSMAADANSPWVERLAAAVEGVAGGHCQTGVPYATNAAFYAAAGVPSVVFGPGRLEQAHTADEWIAIDELQQAAEILYRFCRGASNA